MRNNGTLRVLALLLLLQATGSGNASGEERLGRGFAEGNAGAGRCFEAAALAEAADVEAEAGGSSGE
jgi:hypothetical protein